MLAPRWLQDFEAHTGRHRDVTVTLGEPLDPDHADALGRSLATFQLGESGTGEHLIAAAQGADCGDAYVESLRAFVKEEQEHARLLALVLAAIDHPIRTSHWTDRVFVFVRRLKSLRTEVLTLLVAELIALRYYSALRDGVTEPALADVFARIHADEVRHVDFHADTLPAHIHTWPGLVRGAVRILWNTLVTATSVIVAIDHRAALQVAGLGPLRFVADVWVLRRDLDGRLFSARATRGNSAARR